MKAKVSKIRHFIFMKILQEENKLCTHAMLQCGRNKLNRKLPDENF